MITMAHTAITDPADEVAMQPGAVASKVVLRAHGLNVTVFGSTPANRANTRRPAPRSSRSCLGRLRFTVYGEPLALAAPLPAWPPPYLSAWPGPGCSNVELQTIMAKTRHRNPRSAMRYVKPGAETVADATDLLDLGRGHG